MDMKMPGCCTLCDAPLFEIIKVHAEGYLKGLPETFGAPSKNAWRVTFVTMNGTRTDMTFCEDCLPKIDDNMSKIHNKVVRAFIFERGHPRSDQKTHDESMMRSINNSILGVLSKERWVDLIEREYGST